METYAIYLTSEILHMLRDISYNTYWKRVRKNEMLSPLIQKGKRKSFYTQAEKDLILQHFV